MDLRHLEYFVQIIEQGSLLKAARALGLAQPALSKRVASLEAELGTRLLHRTVQGVRPTDAGAQLYRHAQAILRQVGRLRAELDRSGEPLAGTVSMGMLTSLSPLFGPALLGELRGRHAGVRLHVVEMLSEESTQRVRRGELDMALITGDVPARDLNAQLLFEEDLFHVAAGDAAPRGPGRARRGNGDTVRMVDLAGVPLVLPRQGGVLRELVQRPFAAQGIAIDVVAEFDSVHTMAATAISGVASTILPWSVLGSLPRGTLDKGGGGGALSVRRIVEPSITRKVWLVTSPQLPPGPAARMLIAVLPQVVVRVLAGSVPRTRGVRIAPAPKPRKA
jgi:LysR family nitrogen assimilation transcriptional regulator